MIPVGVEHTAQQIVDAVLDLPVTSRRHLIAVAGPPAAGKSTVAALVRDMLQRLGRPTGLVPMDGYHMDNARLSQLGLLQRKGAAVTFDFDQFALVIQRLKTSGSVNVALFDRDRDATVPDALTISPDQKTVVVEGNYLLYDAPGWRDLSQFWDLSVFIEEPLATLNARLVERWLKHGLSEPDANARASANDIPNAKDVLTKRLPASLNLRTNSPG